jgi:hypothetical protein
MLQQHCFVVGDSMLIAIIDKVDHGKTTRTTGFSRCLHGCCLVKRGCIGIDCKYRIPSTQVSETTQDNHLRFWKSKDYGKPMKVGVRKNEG